MDERIYIMGWSSSDKQPLTCVRSRRQKSPNCNLAAMLQVLSENQVAKPATPQVLRGILKSVKAVLRLSLSRVVKKKKGLGGSLGEEDELV